MIVTCPNCTTRLQLEADKVPSRPFNIRCPKCQFIISAQPAAGAAEGGAMAAGGDLPTSRTHRELRSSAPAPAFQLEGVEQPVAGGGGSSAAPVGEGELARLLASLLQRGVAEPEASRGGKGRRWTRRRVLICTATQFREALARSLARGQHEVFIAEDTPQAIERMREDRIDAVILDPDFDPVEQGAAYITREINSLRPAQRRRIFFVQLTGAARTGDQQAAFLNHVNLIVAPSDIDDMAHLLEHTVREYNELYRDFNKALSVAEL